MTTRRIETLTPEQTARFPEFVEKWKQIGLCTDPADRPAAEEAIHEMYRLGGKKPPKKIVWCGSPLSMGVTRAIILDEKLVQRIAAAARAALPSSEQSSITSDPGPRVRASVRASVWASVGASVWDSVGASVGASVWDSVGASVWDSVWDSVRDSVWDSVRASVWDSVSYSTAIWGQHEAGACAFYDFFRTVNGLVTQTDKFQGITNLARSAGWAIPHSNICWVSERHNILLRDEQGRLHNAGGPACAFPDGWAIYAWHGVRVPVEWIERPNELKPETVLKAANLEQRRAGIEMLGWDRILTQLNAKVIDQDPDPRVGTLLEVDLPGIDDRRGSSIKAQFLRVQCGTGRQFALGIDPASGAKTALDAQAWLQGLKADDFRIPQVRT